MEIKYFQDTDTLLINFNNNEIFETKDISNDVLAEVDDKGQIVSITLEHAMTYSNLNNFSFQQIKLANSIYSI